MAAKSKPNELYLTRVYDAPVRLVWDAWTDPEQVAQWWGPRGFTLTTHSKDLRPGGTWRYMMHGPDGTDYPNVTLYHEVEKHAKLVYDHGGSDDRPPLFRVTVLFKETNGKTRMDMTLSFASPEVAGEMKKFIKQAGGDSTWDRLAEFLGKETEGRERFVINRVVHAPAEAVFRLWTDPEHLVHWLPPTGFTMRFIRADIRAGGESFSTMSGPNDVQFFVKSRYLEVTRPVRIVYAQQFCREDGTVSRHPLAPSLPETLLTTVSFTEQEPGETRITLTFEPQGNLTADELAAFVTARAGMTQGWTGSFDRLETLLERAT